MMLVLAAVASPKSMRGVSDWDWIGRDDGSVVRCFWFPGFKPMAPNK